MRPSLSDLIRARVALWHTRRSMKHLQRGERIMLDHAPLIDLADIAGLLALVLVIGCGVK